MFSAFSRSALETDPAFSSSSSRDACTRFDAAAFSATSLASALSRRKITASLVRPSRDDRVVNSISSGV